MANNSSSTGDGIGFVGLLTIAFIVLKLTGVITWSWWWVLSPMLFGLLIILPIIAVILLVSIFMD